MYCIVPLITFLAKVLYCGLPSNMSELQVLYCILPLLYAFRGPSLGMAKGLVATVTAAEVRYRWISIGIT